MPNLLGYVKVTMQFALGRQSWSESHWYGTQVLVTDPGLYTAAQNLVKKRALLMGGNVTMGMCKFSQEGINRDVDYLSRADLPQLNAAGNYDGAPPYPPPGSQWAFQSPQVSWPIKLLDKNNNQIAITYCGGMPASSFQTGPGPLDVSVGGDPPWNYLKKYGAYLVTGPWGAASRTWPAGVFQAGNSTAMTANPSYIAAAGATPAQIVFTLPATIVQTNNATGGTANVAPFAGMWVRIGGVKYTTPQRRLRLNGTYQLFQNTGPNTWSVLAPRVLTAPVFTSPGYIQGAAYFWQQYNSFVTDNITHRKRGVSTGGVRGRRS